MSHAKRVALDQRRITKSLNTLMGIVSGIVCDGHLHDGEIQYLSTWLKDNEDISPIYPANVISRRLTEVLQDGVITLEEKNHLIKELTALSGTDFANTGSALPDQISSVFDDDPHIIFKDNVFVLTGEFLYGTRPKCEDAIAKRGGINKTTVTQKTNYLVVGSMASPDWIVANFGRKIQTAAEMSKSGEFEIAIVREADWAMSL
jgi:NAD-dependent DNA ligase